MTPADYLGLMALTAYVALVAAVVFSGDCEQACRLECPLRHHVVRCRIAHDVRSGRWLRVLSCSAFASGNPSCSQDCVRLTNLGVLRTVREPCDAARR